MNLQYKMLPLEKVAQILNIHHKTLDSWFCHFTLSRYVYETPYRGKLVRKSIIINRGSLRALKRYLAKKHPKFLSKMSNIEKELLKYARKY